METVYILYLLLAVIASFISALFGLGAALILLSVGAYLFSPAEAIALSTIIFTSNTIARSITMWRHIPWKKGLFMAAVSIPFAYLGATHMALLPTDLLRKLLGGLILLQVVVSWKNFQIDIKHSLPNFTMLSASYGYISGLLGTGNTIKAIFFHHMGYNKQAFIGLMAVTSIPANMVKLYAYHDYGLMEFVPDYMPYALVTVSITIALIGKYALKKLPDKGFKTGLQVVLTFAAIGLIFFDPVRIHQ